MRVFDLNLNLILLILSCFISKQNQIRDANLKNQQNHQYNNIHQYIVQLQKEKQELQSQLVDLVQNADAKRTEIEKLQKELKQLKEKYYHSKKQEALQQQQELLLKANNAKNSQEFEPDTKQKDEKLSDKLSEVGKDGKSEDKSSDSLQQDDLSEPDPKRPTSSVEGTVNDFDSQPGPSGLS